MADEKRDSTPSGGDDHQTNVTDSKQDVLHLTVDRLHDHASWIVSFTSQWKAMETKFNSMCLAIDDRLKQVSLAEEAMRERAKEIETREKELEGNEGRVRERSRELVVREKALEVREKTEIEERKRDIERVEKWERELLVIQESNMKKLKEGEERKVRFKEINERIEEKVSFVVMVEGRVDAKRKEIEEKEKEIQVKEKAVEICCKDLESKQKKLDEWQEWMRVKEEEFDKKVRALRGKEREFVGKERQIKEREFKVEIFENRIKERDGELRVKVEDFERKESVLRLKEMEFECKKRELGQAIEHFQMLVEEMESNTKKAEEVELRDSVFEKQSLEPKEMQIEECQREIDLLEEPKIMEEVEEVKLVEGQHVGQTSSHVQKEDETSDAAMVDSVFPRQTAVVDIFLLLQTDGKALQKFLNQNWDKGDATRSEAVNALRLSSDPAKLVLNAMEGFYGPYRSEEKVEFEESVVRRSCIFLLEQLMKLSPVIQPQVRKEAMRVAFSWLPRLTSDSEHSSEVLGFLHFLASYGLASSFDENVLLNQLKIISQHSQAPELRRILGLDGKISTKFPKEESSVGKLSAEGKKDSSFQDNPRPQPDVTSSAKVSTEDLTLLLRSQKNPNLLQEEIHAVLQFASDPAKLVLETLKNGYPLENFKKLKGLKRNYFVVLQKLGRNKPTTNPKLKEEAMKFAKKWRGSISSTPGGPIEAVCFLQFVAVYGLVSSFDAFDLLSLLDTLHWRKEAPDLCQVLGIEDEIPKFIRDLVAKGRHLPAFKHVFALDVVDKFQPAALLDDHLRIWSKKYAGKSSFGEGYPGKKKTKDINREINELRNVSRVLKQYKVEVSDKVLKEHISQLENQVAEAMHKVQGLTVKTRHRTRNKESGVSETRLKEQCKLQGLTAKTGHCTSNKKSGVSDMKDTEQCKKKLDVATATDIPISGADKKEECEKKLDAATATGIPFSDSSRKEESPKKLDVATATDIPISDNSRKDECKRKLDVATAADIPKSNVSSIPAASCSAKTQTQLQQQTANKRPRVAGGSSRASSRTSTAAKHVCPPNQFHQVAPYMNAPAGQHSWASYPPNVQMTPHYNTVTSRPTSMQMNYQNRPRNPYAFQYGHPGRFSFPRPYN